MLRTYASKLRFNVFGWGTSNAELAVVEKNYSIRQVIKKGFWPQEQIVRIGVQMDQLLRSKQLSNENWDPKIGDPDMNRDQWKSNLISKLRGLD